MTNVLAIGRRLLSALALLLVFGAAVAIGFVVNFIVLATNSSYNPRTYGAIEGKHYTVRMDRTLELIASDKTVVVRGRLGVNLPVPVHPSTCYAGSDRRCMMWGNTARLEVLESEDGKCQTFGWHSFAHEAEPFQDCFLLTGSHWYGGAEVRKQLWPIEKWDHAWEMYIAGNSHKSEYGGVIERYWFSSSGIAVTSPVDVPLVVSVNSSGDHQLCLTARYRDTRYKNINNTSPNLKYTVCHGENLTALHLYMRNKFFPKPSNIPDMRMFRDPIWSTWVVFKKDVNQSKIIDFAKSIRRYNFTDSQLEIDDDWTPHYGDLTFDPSKFPDAKGMVRVLKKMGFRLTVWVHPFASPLSKAFRYGVEKGYWVKTMFGAPGLTIWWNGVAALLDVTNPEAVDWFKAVLRNLTIQYGVDSFKFDAGERSWLPYGYKLHHEYVNPDMYAKNYAELGYAADRNVRHQEVRVGAHAQHLPIFVRMMDRDSNWGYDNGLKTLIPTALTFGLLGYPFVLPDMIGGNGYNNRPPSRELYIRWVELNALLPAMQFSIPPWAYDDEVVRISKQMADLHIQYTPLIVELARESTRTGAPIIRPLWWVAPHDSIAQQIDSEFLVGDDVLVAPVVEEGATKRDIYLPAGLWKDVLRGRNLVGGIWYPEFEVQLHELAFFTRIKD